MDIIRRENESEDELIRFFSFLFSCFSSVNSLFIRVFFYVSLSNAKLFIIANKFQYICLRLNRKLDQKAKLKKKYFDRIDQRN